MLNPISRAQKYIVFYILDLFSILASCLTMHFVFMLISSAYGEFFRNASYGLYMLVTASTPLTLLSMGLYDIKIRQSTRSVFMRILYSAFLTMSLTALLFGTFSASSIPYNYIFMSLCFGGVMQFIWRMWLVYNGGLNGVKRQVVFVGAGERAAFIPKRMRRFVDRRAFEFSGFIPLKYAENGTSIFSKEIAESETILSPPVGMPLDDYIASLDVDVLVLSNDKGEKLPINALLACKMRGIDIVELDQFIESEMGQIAIESMRREWLLSSKGFKAKPRFTQPIEYVFNAALAVLVLCLTWPILVVATLFIYFDDGRVNKASIFYIQERIGLNGNAFNIIKFRSMGIDAEANGAQWASKDDMRVTRVGKYLRKYRIDELPQIINVLKGEMCFVGPRPERTGFVKTLANNIPHFNFRHCVKPGLTGWAQIKYPYGASEEDSFEKLKYDLYYIKHKSFLLDLVILFRTLEVILFGRGR